MTYKYINKTPTLCSLKYTNNKIVLNRDKLIKLDYIK